MRLLLKIDWSFLDRKYMGEKVSDYLWFAGIVLATLLLKKPLANLLTRVSSHVTARYSYIRHKEAIRNLLFKPFERLLQTILFYVAINQLERTLDRFYVKPYFSKKLKMHVTLGDVVDHIFLFLFIVFLTQVISSFIDFIYYLRMGKAEVEHNHSRQQLLPLIKEVSKLVLWVLSGFWILGAVFHVNIPALITGLGIGGVAIALAGKETVENFFAAFTILSDRPFLVGDTIKLGETEGVVERIGFRSTRLRNIDGAAYIVPNQNLVSQNLVNLSARSTRGMKVVANIRYGVDHDTLQRLISDVKDTLHHTHPVKDPIEATIETFDKDTFQLVISYHLPHPLPEHMKLADLKREINMKVFQVISRHAILGAPPSVN